MFTGLLGIGLGLGLSLIAGTAAEAPLAGTTGVIRLEAETGQLSGSAVVVSKGTGFSGTGYVTGFIEDTDKVVLTFQAHAGLYGIAFRYRSPLKGFIYEVNGVPLSGKFADSTNAFLEQPMGKIQLHEGTNTLVIHGGWKLYDIDRVDLTPVAKPTAVAKPPAILCDPQGTPAARALMSYLVGEYGERTLSGTIEGPDVDYVQKVTGQLPAILAGDMLNVTTAAIRNAGVIPGETEQMIERAKQGHILTYCWHWRAPTGLVDKEIVGPDGTKLDARWYRGFYTYATTFDLAEALAHPEGRDYTMLIADIDMVAGELSKLSDWGIPVLWRPLHEAEGGWFWWGARGPKPFIELWRLLHDRMTRVHGLHNLIWVYTGTANPAWYPGDDVVDIIGLDDYPADVRDPLSAGWDDEQARFGGRKLVALSEFGGVPDVTESRQVGVAWSYFASWSKELGPMKMTPEALRRIYNDPRVINLSGLPKDRWQPAAEKAVR